ncbi:MAG: AAA family ATPase [Treponema sp.]|nr:AAA family ATPase [Treponema sp.]
MSDLKRIPIGIEDFKEIIDKDYYFVDKTLIIKELIDNLAKVQLFTRPRRFGKTLNMKMIQRFFEKTKENNAYLFDGLAITKAGEKYMKEQGKYPVIFLTLKELGTSSFEKAFDSYKKIIAAEYSRHKEVLNSPALSETDKQRYNALLDFTATDFDYASSIKFLSDCIYKATGTKVIILIDEYDVPLDYAWQNGFYDEMIDLIRTALSSSLKTNDSLEFACLTGCLRISKESIFTGLNNFDVHSITSTNFTRQFGFTETEVKSMLDYYKLGNRMKDVKEWYDGYLFFKDEIYNPWSVLKFLKDAVTAPDFECQAYWSNTSSNAIVKDLVQNADLETKQKIETLINGGTVKAELHEEIVYADVQTKIDGIWNMLMLTGYLKPIKIETVDVMRVATLKIPNKEINYIYRGIISDWFKEEIKNPDNESNKLFEALIAGNAEELQSEINYWLESTISYFDAQELFYHGFMTALLTKHKDYLTKSNRENGDGRTDITVESSPRRNIAIVIELKVAKTLDTLGQKADEALDQVVAQNYDREYKLMGYKKVIKYGISFWKKTCNVRIAEE